MLYMQTPEQCFSQEKNDLQLILSILKERLLSWGRDQEHGWLPRETTETLRYLFQRFYYYYGKTKVSQMGLDGWECGLGQMLDVQNEKIVELLPYLLTAYMFNYRSTKYVSDFINKTMPSTWKASFKDDYFFGVNEDKNFISKVEESSDFTYGIGKFLSSTLPQDGQYAEKVVNNIAHLFIFPDVVIEELPEVYTVTKYIVPKSNIKTFRRRVERAKESGKNLYIDTDGNWEYQRIVYSELKKSDSNPLPEYSRDVFEDIFICWYQVVKSAFAPKTKKVKPCLSYPPNARKNFELLQTSLQRIQVKDLSAVNDTEIEQYLEKSFQYSFSK